MKYLSIIFIFLLFVSCDSDSESSSSKACDIAGFYSGKDHLGHSATLEFYSTGVYSFDSSLGYDFDTFGDWAIEGSEIAMYADGSKNGTCYFDTNCNLVVGDNTWQRVR